MTIERLDHTLTNSEGLPIHVQLRHENTAEPKGLVVICHGFKGFAHWGFFPFAAERLAAAGFTAVSFDFSMNGVGEDPMEFGRLDLFEKNTYSREIEDLERVIAWALSSAPVNATEPFGLLAHSRGTVPAMVLARENEQVGALVTWNGVGSLLRYDEQQMASWKAEGRMEFPNARTGQLMAMSYDFVRDVEANVERFDLAAAARAMAAAHLILHGTDDMAVPIEEADMLRAGRDSDTCCELMPIEGATHTFGAVHPFAGSTPQLDQALDLSVEWFDRYLSS